jgi:signal transduction histidine kinase
LDVGQLLGVTIGSLLVLAVLGVGVALVASGQLSRNRNVLLNQVGPARRAALSLENALVNEETGIRGYVINGETSFLAPYHMGLHDEAHAYAELHAGQKAAGPSIALQIDQVQAKVENWREAYVNTALSGEQRGAPRTIAQEVQGKHLFNAVRASLTHLQGALESKDSQTRKQLDDAASALTFALIVAAILILGGVLGAGYLLRRTITLPLAKLGSEAHRVAGGQFDVPLAIAGGPREVADVGAEIDAMRERIVMELASVEAARARLEAQALELQRSNAELEQFAYVASHDLQEPLRKVTSFCQALQTRYQGQLDERADQYIAFAVDGAKRMQVLISDLLAFSRVGRSGREREPVDLNEVLAAARSQLQDPLTLTNATVHSDPLPTICGERAQLVSLFQNLISNALKFHAEQDPVVWISASRGQEDEWQLSLSDNGIGIDREYADRIFLIFQRLHTREAYEGSGIGLALCRKIVEYHGGRIWLDPDYTDGACFRFTFPTIEERNT